MPAEDKSTRADSLSSGPEAGSDHENPGLPWLRSWRGVYCMVLGAYALYLVLLAAWTRCF
jgi:hypothetical protein